MMKVLAKMSQFVNKTFALWVVIFGIAGFVFPEICKQIGPWIARFWARCRIINH